jgi:multidrug efflux pump subunit AcrA (membrane-fusion protein)
LAAAQAMAADAKKAIEGAAKKNKDVAELGANLDAVVVTLPKEITEDNVLAAQETVKSATTQIGSIKAAFDQLQAAKPAKGKKKKK